MRGLRSLNALKAFEAAARLNSFAEAAKELCVTPGAVSRQVRALEKELGTPLFERLSSKVVLRDAGRELLPHLTQIFDQIAEVTQSVARRQHELTIRVQPTFAIRWLIPRLHRFQLEKPEIRIRLITVAEKADFRSEGFDAAIIYGNLNHAGLIQEPIHTEKMTPVCSPSLCTGSTSIKKLEDLKKHRLLLNSADQHDWRVWSEAAGIKDLPLEQGQVFETDDAALQAAVAGFGVALGDLLLIRENLRDGLLIAPFFDIPAVTAKYYFATSATQPISSATVAFKAWILSELAACG